MKTMTFPVKGLNVAGCAREIEKRLGKQAGISQVEASYVAQTVTWFTGNPPHTDVVVHFHLFDGFPSLLASPHRLKVDSLPFGAKTWQLMRGKGSPTSISSIRII